jgi:hypothetical protein
VYFIFLACGVRAKMVSLEYRCLKLRKLLGWPDSIELDIFRAVFGFCCQNFIKI